MPVDFSRQGWNDFWTGVTSPQGQAALSQGAQVSAAAGAGLVSPAAGIPSTVASTVVASVPTVVQRQFDPWRVAWGRYKNPLLVASVISLGGGAAVRSSGLAIVGAVALGGWFYGRSKYGA